MTNDEMADALRKLGWTVEPPWTPENCKHESRNGTGTFNGSHSTVEWSCPRCGKHERHVSTVEPTIFQA